MSKFPTYKESLDFEQKMIDDYETKIIFEFIQRDISVLHEYIPSEEGLNYDPEEEYW